MNGLHPMNAAPETFMPPGAAPGNGQLLNALASLDLALRQLAQRLVVIEDALPVLRHIVQHEALPGAISDDDYAALEHRARRALRESSHTQNGVTREELAEILAQRDAQRDEEYMHSAAELVKQTINNLAASGMLMPAPSRPLPADTSIPDPHTDTVDALAQENKIRAARSNQPPE